MLRKDEILERTNNGLNVFKHYIPGTWRVGRNFLNPLYEDSKASCNIYFDRRSRTMSDVKGLPPQHAWSEKIEQMLMEGFTRVNQGELPMEWR